MLMPQLLCFATLTTLFPLLRCEHCKIGSNVINVAKQRSCDMNIVKQLNIFISFSDACNTMKISRRSHLLSRIVSRLTGVSSGTK